MTCSDHAAKRDRARELRLAGLSRAQISREVGVRNHKSLDRWLSGLPAPDWTRRPRAKDELHEEAIRLRKTGLSYREIAEQLGVSKSSLSLWLRNIPLSKVHQRLLNARTADAYARRAATMRLRTDRKDSGIRSKAAEEIGAISPRELFIAGVIAYWAEGSKAKPWNRSTPQVQFINSDPTMITLFLRWLDALGIERDRIKVRVAIHEFADVAGALRFWSDVVGIPEGEFQRTTLKRHNPSTVRKNTGSGYVGCLTIKVRRSSGLLRQIAGWYEGIVKSLGSSVNVASTRSFEVRGSGSTPESPATFRSTLFEPAPAYEWQRAV